MNGPGLAVRIARLGRAMREAGVGLGLSDEIDAARALSHIDLTDAEEVKGALRIALKVPHPDWPLFERLFAEFWSGEASPPSVPPRSTPGRPAANRGGRFPRWNAQRGQLEEEPEAAGEGEVPGWSPASLFRSRPFPEIAASDLAALERLLAQWALRLATRPSRRLVPSPGRGIPDLRRSFRRAVRQAGEFVSLARRRRAVEVPRLVFLCDSSGSMAPYTRFVLMLVLALARVVRRTEVFAFNTALTRLTPCLAPDKIALSLERLVAGVPDWGGGTRIGECLGEFVERHAAASVDHRTVVVVLSDGLDRGDTERLRDAMRRIKQRARKVIWLNPLLGDPRYRPEARGMAAALPFVDHFASAHDLGSLARLLPHLAA